VTPQEIRKKFGIGTGTNENTIEVLNELVVVMAEVAAQLAELNERAAVVESGR
jgi:hypothetical protein